MKMLLLGVTTVACLTGAASNAPAATTTETDLCVFGGTSAGVSAAIQASRMGKRGIILEPGKHLGGLTSGGLGATDIGNKGAIGGISREFYRRLGQHYGTNEAWKFEPHVAENMFRTMAKEAGVAVHYDKKLSAVKKSGQRITEIVTEDGSVYRAPMFIDATYEGDLLARAGVSFTVGREPNSQYGETLNGVRAETPAHQFKVAVDPYVRPGDPASGLLPFIQEGSGGKPGAGDQRVQAYNYRLCFTTNAANRMPLDPPPGYDPARFELLARYLEALVAAGHKPQLREFWNPIWMPNQKTDINNNGGFSTDFIGESYGYAEADYATRASLERDHENYTRGFLTFLATSARVPDHIRSEMQTWGPCRDEFTDNHGWPHQLYVREARRMVSGYVMTEHHCRGAIIAPDAAGLAAYNMDSHNCQRVVKNGRVENEGDVQVGVSPYPISYRALVPKQAECENLLVPVCLAATHIAYGSIRMEPVFMILGQSAATAAMIALERGVPVQAVEYETLRRRLLADKQILDWTGTTTKPGPPPWLDGIVIDDSAGEKQGEWLPSGNHFARLVGNGYLHDNNANKGGVAITYRARVREAGRYELILVSPPHANRATAVPVVVSVGGKPPHSFKVNQRISSRGFAALGDYELKPEDEVIVTVSNQDTDGYVVADGLQLKPAK